MKNHASIFSVFIWNSCIPVHCNNNNDNFEIYIALFINKLQRALQTHKSWGRQTRYQVRINRTYEKGILSNPGESHCQQVCNKRDLKEETEQAGVNIVWKVRSLKKFYSQKQQTSESKCNKINNVYEMLLSRFCFLVDSFSASA